MAEQAQVWKLWMPEGGAQSVSFACGRLDATDTLLVHAAGAVLTLEVHGGMARSLRVALT